MLEQRFGLTLVLRDLLGDRALDDPRTDKADLGARLTDEHVAQRAKARERTAEARVCQHRHVGQLGGRVFRDSRRGFRHLHQGEHALLDPRAATSQDRDNRQLLSSGYLERARDLLAHDGPHRAAEEIERQRDEDDWLTIESGLAGQCGFVHAGPPLGFTQSGPVRRRFFESKRIRRKEALAYFLERVAVGEVVDPLLGGKWGVPAARRAHVELPIELGFGVRRLTGMARDGRRVWVGCYGR